jgi:drug/metabolite transporter (DMT)-like permease
MQLILPLIAAIAFAAGSLVFKRAFAEGASLSHAVVVNNVILGLLFLPLMAWDPHPIPWDRLHLPFVTASTFVAGHLFNVAALRVGDVSVATPLLGVKVVFVALIAHFAFGWPMSGGQWMAAVLTSAGVLITGLTDFKPGRRTGWTTLLALLCAGSFAVTDVLIQMWAAEFGVLNFLSLLFGALALESILVLPLLGFKARPETQHLSIFRQTIGSLTAPPRAWRWIGLATSLSAVQALLITGTIANWRDAAGVNVVYGTRGLWSLALVWWAGSWFGNAERRDSGPQVLLARAAGGALILAAVILALRTAPQGPLPGR